MNYNNEKYALKIFKALANIHRIRIIKKLSESPTNSLNVNQLSEVLKMDQGKLSNHLVRMRNDGFLKAKQDKTHMYYSIKDANIAKILTQIL